MVGGDAEQPARLVDGHAAGVVAAVFQALQALDEQGNVYVATLLPDGNVFASNGGITVISPDGAVLEFIETAVGGIFDPLPSNTKLLQIGLRDWEMGKNWPAEIARLPHLGGLEDAQIERIFKILPDIIGA